MSEQVTIHKKRYDDLLESERILNALYAGGVDNWEWYEEALGNMEDVESEDDEDA